MNKSKQVKNVEQGDLEYNRRQERLNNLNNEQREYISLIDDVNDTCAQCGLDLTSYSESKAEDYLTSNVMINQVKANKEFKCKELELWQLLKRFITLDNLMVRMNFSEYDSAFRQLLYWGNDFLKMKGIDLLYMTYLMLDKQLLKKPSSLDGVFKDNSMRIYLPSMTARFENEGFTCIDFDIHAVGNLNVIAKKAK